MFIDASVLCAILLKEADADRLLDRLDASESKITSPVAVVETGLRLMRESGGDVAKVRIQIATLLEAADIRVVKLGEAEADAALDAHARFGKGRHPARLNMGDCFAYAYAYACARTHGVPLLYKGGDFALTDVQAA